MGAASFAAGASIGAGFIAKSSLDTQVKFQQSMVQLRTQAGASEKQVRALSRAVLDMSTSVGTGPKELADGMYHVVSSLNATLPPAQRVATEMKVMRIAAEGAKVGNANLVDVTNALDAAVVSGMKGVSNYSKAMGALNAIVGAGDMKMQDLADALSTGVLGPMKTFGLSLKDVGGALAVFGDNNIRGQDAATKLTSAVRIMAAPSKAAAKELAGVGLSTLRLANDMRTGGLVKAFQDLRDHLKASGKSASEQALIISRAFGGRQSTGVQLLLGQFDRLKAKTIEVAKGAGTFGGSWQATTQTLAFQMSQLQAAFQTMGAVLGAALAPVVPALVSGANALLGFVKQMQAGKGAGGEFAKVVSTGFGAVKSVVLDVSKAFGGLGNVIKGVAIALGALAIVKTFSLIVGGISPATLALVAMAAAAALIVKNWKTVGPFLASVWNGIKAVAQPVIAWLVNAWDNATNAISKAAKAAFPTVKTIAIVAFDAIKVGLALLKTAFDATWNVIGPLVRGVMNGIKWGVTSLLVPAFQFLGNHLHTLESVFSAVFGTIKGIVVTVIDFVLGAFSTLLHAAGGVFDVLKHIPILGNAFKGLGGDVNNAANKIDALRNALKGLPAKKTVTVDIAGSFTSTAAALLGAFGGGHGGTAPRHGGHFASGGMVTRPTFFAGEEAPQHPEVVLATNPAYRGRNVSLWQKAGKMLGVRGFAAGGVTSPAQIPSQATGAQIRLAELANMLQAAQNSGNIPAQQKILGRELKFDQSLMSMDRSRLTQIDRALGRGGLSRAKRAQMLQDKLALLQEIGSIISSIGSANSTLTGLTGGGGAGVAGSFDLAPGGGQVKLPTAYDVHQAIARPHIVVAPRFHIHATGAHAAAIQEVVEDAVAAMADSIDRGVSGRLHARTRSAGLR